MDAMNKTDAVLWQERMGYTGKQVALAAESLGMSGRIFMRRRAGQQELTLTDRLAMAALRAGLPPWSSETDQHLADLAELAAVAKRVAGHGHD